MDIYREQVEKVKKQLDELTSFCESAKHRMPQGNLVKQTIGGKHYYYHSTGSGNNYNRRGISREPELIGRLAGKEFLRIINDAANYNIKVLETALSRLKSLDPADIIKRMSLAAQTVPVEMVLSQEITGMEGRRNEAQGQDEALRMRLREYQQWASADFRQSSYRLQEKIHLTSSGIYVRSKSEALIAKKLISYGVPFRYEQLINIDGKWFSPDFTIMIADGRLLYWEHAGMMDNESYVSKHLTKMSYYQRAEIVPWKNLIVTYDNERGLDMEIIDFIIRHVIKKQL